MGRVIYSSRMKVLVVVGTRPEAIKLDPFVRAAAQRSSWVVQVVCTGQHDVLLAPLAGRLGFEGTTLAGEVSMHEALRDAIVAARPDVVVGQGDTASALEAARVSTGLGIAFVHVEAGLRTGDLQHPCPEESYRVEIARLATLHLAPTIGAREHLLREGVCSTRIVVTGNTGADATAQTLAGLPADGSAPSTRASALASRRVLITMHRRESLEGGLQAVCASIEALARRHEDVDFVLPLHANPRVMAIVEHMGAYPNVRRLAPLRHDELLWVLRGSAFTITDSGGVQEEACAVRVPALIARRRTERVESIARGWAKLVGWDRTQLESWADAWLDDPRARARATPTADPFGDGRAAMRCVDAMRWWAGESSEPPPPWTPVA